MYKGLLLISIGVLRIFVTSSTAIEISNSPLYIKQGINTFKMKNPLIEGGDDIKITINVQI
jgi:hypothetical protein